MPFYFTPFSPMLYNIKTGYNGIKQRPMNEIVIFVSSLRLLEGRGIPFVFSDRMLISELLYSLPHLRTWTG